MNKTSFSRRPQCLETSDFASDCTDLIPRPMLGPTDLESLDIFCQCKNKTNLRKKVELYMRYQLGSFDNFRLLANSFMLSSFSDIGL